ncbi:hypothetical protein B566_EDAN002477 [Ephemera danica]|nr:hypothetical protein B566_EDAN002477 [Ephemera danica]
MHANTSHTMASSLVAADEDHEVHASPRGSKSRDHWAKRKARRVTTKKFWLRHIPVVGFLTRGYDFATFFSDVIAGITVGLTFIPSCMASAVLAGLPAQRCVVIGPTVLTAMLCRPFVDKFGMEVAFTLSMYSGLLVLALGLLNMSFVVHFISAPVLDGFLSAASLSAISSQIAPLFGFPGGGTTFVEYWINIIRNVQDYGVALWDSVLGFSCIIALVSLQLLRPISDVPEGNITDGLPQFIPPPFTLEYNNETLGFLETVAELGTAITMPLIIIVESTAAAKAFAVGQSIDAVQELIATGTVNVLGSFLQSMPCAASVTRTTVSYNAGARTPVGGFFAGSLVLIALGVFSRALSYMPDAALAAVVITAVYFLLQIHNHTLLLWRTNNRRDLIPLWVTFLGCLLLGLDYGLIFGIVANALLLLAIAARPNVELTEVQIQKRKVLLAKPDRSVSYPGAEQVRRAIVKPSRSMGAGLLVVLDGKHVAKLDSTAVKSLVSMVGDLETRHQEVLFWNFREHLISKFNRPQMFRTGENLEQIISSEFAVPKTSPTTITAEVEEDSDSDAESTNSRNSAAASLRDLP